VFGHEGWALADFGFAVSAEIGEDQAIARLQSGDDGRPEFMMGGKGMQKNDGRSVALNFVEDFGVIAAQGG
jgi:hypothetical protein